MKENRHLNAMCKSSQIFFYKEDHYQDKQQNMGVG